MIDYYTFLGEKLSKANNSLFSNKYYATKQAEPTQDLTKGLMHLKVSILA